MATIVLVDIDLPEAKTFEDHVGIKTDLEDVQQFLNRLRSIAENLPVDMQLVDLLTTATLVRYARPYSNGVRARLDPTTLGLSPAEMLAHKRFIDWRSKHVAHSVNPFEENQLVAQFALERVETEGVIAVSVRQERIVGLSSEEIETLQEICRTAILYIDSIIQREQGILFELVKQIPIKEIKALQMQLRRVGMESVSKSR